MTKLTYFIFLIFLGVSCGRSSLTPAEYIAWLDTYENGLVKDYKQDNIRLTCQYMSPAYAVLKQNDPNNLKEQEINQNIGEVSDLVQFKLKFENTKTNNFLKDNYTTTEEFNTRSTYLSYDIRTDLRLVNGEDTVTCVLNHHERTYGNTPYETLLISFPNSSTEKNDLELIFDDRVFGLGRVKFFFEKEVLESIPELVF